jgi:circadian clock protein KaiB
VTASEPWSADAYASQIPTGQEQYELTLFVNGASGRSAQAITNIRALCVQYLPGRYQLDVVNIRDHPELVIEHRVLASPTLVKARPLPARMLVGDLSEVERVLVALDIPTPTKPRETSG